MTDVASPHGHPPFALFAERLFTGRDFAHARFVAVQDGRITSVGSEPPPGLPVEDLPGGWVLAPGFVDLQVNGGGGVLFNDAPNAAGMATIAAAHRRFGTTSILPTVISGSRALMRAAIDAVAGMIGQDGIVGLHLEGPFLNPVRRGIHPAEAITAIGDDDIALLAAPFPGPLLITAAPDCVAPETIRRLADAGRIVFAGHTLASYEQTRAALDAGLAGFTHLFNAMAPLAARDPGVAGAALTDARAFAGIILDGLHIHPAMATLALRTIGPDRLFLVSDAMPTVGGPDEFILGGTHITLVDGKLTDAIGTLAGAHLTMADAVRNAVQLLGCPLANALRMATQTPARCIGLGGKIGQVGAGARADLVALDTDLRPATVWFGGTKFQTRGI